MAAARALNSLVFVRIFQDPVFECRVGIRHGLVDELGEMSDADRRAAPPKPACHVHDATGVTSHQRLGSGGLYVVEFFVKHCARDIRHLDRKSSAEAATHVGPFQRP